jgi:aspartyl-tRNA(Asn)/glutamyl-tRNA(Gln) amidotransferase subunit A
MPCGKPLPEGTGLRYGPGDRHGQSASCEDPTPEEERMHGDELTYLSAADLAAQIRQKQISPKEVVGAVLSRIERVNPRLNAYCAVTADAARTEACAAEASVLRGDRLGPLCGVPFSVKDLVITRGVRTAFGSRIYEHHVPEEDAPVVERLKAAGAILVGKTATPEFGWKGVTDSPLTGISRNPWDLTKTPGGSSGGAAAAVAAGLAPLAVGTDGGGSIRIPGSFCGVFGLKPTYGLVPVYPAPATGTLSHVGPMTRTVRDAALMLQVMAGPDERDPLSFPAMWTDFPSGLTSGIRGLRVAWSPTFGYAQVDPEVRSLAEAAARRFQDLGCRVEEVERPFEDPDPIWSPVFYAGIAARLRDSLPEWRDRIDPGLLEIIEEGSRLSAVELSQATFARAAFYQEVRRFFERFDLLLSPTLAVPPFPAGRERPADSPRGSRLAWVAFTYPFNLTGQPAATVPCGFTAAGLPVGLQIVGRRLQDALVLRASAAFEAAAPWSGRRPLL